jgi:anti-anti-sigma regulatory factor
MALDVQVPAPRPPGDASVPAGQPGGAAVFVLPAEIDIANSAGVAAALCGLLRAGAVIADLTSTTFCDSSGIAALLRASSVREAIRGR